MELLVVLAQDVNVLWRASEGFRSRLNHFQSGSRSVSQRERVFLVPESEAVLQFRTIKLNDTDSAISLSCLSRTSCFFVRESASLSSIASTMEKCYILNCSSSAFKFGIYWLARSRVDASCTLGSSVLTLFSNFVMEPVAWIDQP